MKTVWALFAARVQENRASEVVTLAEGQKGHHVSAIPS